MLCKITVTKKSRPKHDLHFINKTECYNELWFSEHLNFTFHPPPTFFKFETSFPQEIQLPPTISTNFPCKQINSQALLVGVTCQKLAPSR